MPGLNQTGPLGRSPMTGRGRGPCVDDMAAYRAPISHNAGMGRGLGYGRGRGLGRGFGPGNADGRRTNRTLSPQTNTQNLQVEIQKLQNQAASMQRSLDAINERISEIGKNE